MRTFLLVIGCVLALSFPYTSVETVQACGGGPPAGISAIDLILSGWSQIVVGRVRTASDSGINAILDVEYFLKGDGDDEFILLRRLEPAVVSFVLDGYASPYQCADIPTPIRAGQLFIAGLGREPVGSYFGQIITENSEGLFTMNATDQPNEYVTVDYEDMIARVAERLNETPRVPQRRVLPHPVVVRITTNAEEALWLTADQTTLAPVPRGYSDRAPDACLPLIPGECTEHLIAPNGVYRVDFYPLGTGIVNYLGQMRHYLVVEGEGGVFSPWSDLFTVWAGQELHVYATYDQRGFGVASAWIMPNLVGSFVGEQDDPLIVGAGAWSPNGRTFAFSTQFGVWQWDALTPGAQPRLLVSTNDLPIFAQSYSPRGNYLRLESGLRRYYVDLATLQEYPDGAFSPDDRLLAVYDTNAAEPTPLTINTLLPRFGQSPGFGVLGTGVLQFQWTSRRGYIYAACGDPINEPELALPPGFDQPWCKVQDMRIGDSFGQWTDGTAFAYDPVTDSLATLVNGNTITLNGEYFDFADQFDGEIVHIELVPLIDLEYRNF